MLRQKKHKIKNLHVQLHLPKRMRGMFTSGKVRIVISGNNLYVTLVGHEVQPVGSVDLGSSCSSSPQIVQSDFPPRNTSSALTGLISRQ